MSKVASSLPSSSPDKALSLGQCQHPRARTAGACQNPAIGEYDIPGSYLPDRRHNSSPIIPRPRALLCRSHAARVRAFIEGSDLDAGSHQAQCAVCSHPDPELRDRAVDLWIGWVWTTSRVCSALRVSRTSWNKHVAYFNLIDKKSDRVNTKRALVLAAERGLEGDGHNARTGLLALRLLQRERGDQSTLNINVNKRDLSQLSADELEKEAEELLAMIRRQKAAGELPAGDSIDVPYTVVSEDKE